MGNAQRNGKGAAAVGSVRRGNRRVMAIIVIWAWGVGGKGSGNNPGGTAPARQRGNKRSQEGNTAAWSRK